jgi:hypothetical protein
MNTGEETIAIAYLYRADDQDNKCMLTTKRLVVVYEGKVFSLEREHIRSVDFEQRRLLLPLVSGGIIAPFSLLAIFLNLYNLWYLMLLFFLGLLLFYLGLQQQPTLSIRDSVKSHDFFLREITPNLRAFVNFSRQLLFGRQSLLYLPLKSTEWQVLKHRDKIAPASLEREGSFRLLNQEQLEQWKRREKGGTAAWVILHIQPLEAATEFYYRQSEDSPELYAYAQQAISARAIIHVSITE